MSRARVEIDQKHLPSGIMAGATVTVKVAGKTSALVTLFADSQSAGTLANPYTTPNGRVICWIPGQQDVDVTVTPTSGSPATLTNQHATAATPQHQTLAAFGGKVVNWFHS